MHDGPHLFFVVRRKACFADSGKKTRKWRRAFLWVLTRKWIHMRWFPTAFLTDYICWEMRRLRARGPYDEPSNWRQKLLHQKKVEWKVPKYHTSARYDKNAILCTVLPRPISSARIPFIPWNRKRHMPFKSNYMSCTSLLKSKGGNTSASSSKMSGYNCTAWNLLLVTVRLKLDSQTWIHIS